MKIYMIRHGATLGNTQKRYVGTTDEDLLESSCNKLREAGERWTGEYELPELVVTSPMRRCVQTAESLFAGVDKRVEADFRECDFGLFEYKNYQELNGNPEYQKFIDSMGKSGFPQGETQEKFQERCVKAFENIISDCREKKVLALVLHGGTIMSILDRFSQPHRDYYDWQIQNGEILQMQLDFEDGKIVCSDVSWLTI